MRKYISSRGLALILIVTILMTVSTIAIAFSKGSRIERKASINYDSKMQAKFACYAGVDFAITTLTEYITTNTDYSNEDIWPLDLETSIQDVYRKFGSSIEADEQVSFQAGTYPSSAVSGKYHYYISGALGNVNTDGTIKESVEEKKGVRYFYSIKAIDTQGLININSHIAIPGNTTHQTAANATLKRILDTLRDECIQSLGLTGSAASTARDEINPIITKIMSTSITGPTNPDLPLPKRWESMSTLYDSLKGSLGNYEGWSSSRKLFWNNICTDSWIDTTTCVRVLNLSASDVAPHPVPTYRIEARAPVNVNSASLEVLKTILQIKARPVLLNNSSISHNMDSGVAEDTSITSTPERDTIDLTSYHDLLGNAIKTATNTENFKSWGDFNTFLIGRTFTVQNSWHSKYTSNDSAGLGTDVWNKVCRDIFRANFNSNTLDNIYNPSKFARLRATKGDLFAPSGSVLEYTHTTEFCFFRSGSFTISVLGYGVNTKTYEVISSSYCVVDLSLLDIYKHTTQKDFESTDATFTNTISFPRGKTDDVPLADCDVTSGRIEPIVRTSPSTGSIYASDFGLGRDVAAKNIDLESGTSNRIINRGLLNPAMNIINAKMGKPRDNSKVNNLVNDGLFSSRTQYSSLAGSQFYSIPALLSGGEGARRGMNYPGDSAGGNTPAPRSTATPGLDNVPYYKGTLEFWVKFTEDTRAQVPCGLMSATLVNLHPSGSDPDQYESNNDDYAFDSVLPDQTRSEGVQFYLFKNSFGQLRLTRLYFCLCYDASGTSERGTPFVQDADAWQYDHNPVKWGDVPSNRWDSTQKSAGYYFPVPRRDVVLSDINLKPGTWHHIFITWHDGAAGTAGIPTITIDGSTATPIAREYYDAALGSKGSKPGFAILNEKDPRDCLNINGFFRPQARTSTGVFQLSDSNVYFPANATMNNVRFYNNVLTYVPRTPFFNSPSGLLSSTYRNKVTIEHGGTLVRAIWKVYNSDYENNGMTADKKPFTRVTVDGVTVNASMSTGSTIHESCDLSGYVSPGSKVDYRLTFMTPNNSETASFDEIVITVLRTNVKHYTFVD